MLLALVCILADGVMYFAKKSKNSDKEKANDIPSWAKGQKSKSGESGSEFAKRVMDKKYGDRGGR